MSQWTLAQRAHKMNPSVIREILKVTERPGIISFAGGLPSSKTFPAAEFKAACDYVLTHDASSALQYSASEGYAPLRELIARQLGETSAAAGLRWDVDPASILITTGSQQGLDLVAKVLVDAGSRVLVESPTYLGAIQAFTPMEPTIVGVDSDEYGVLPDGTPGSLRHQILSGADKARFMYLLPNFQNPTGRTMTEERRAAVSALAAEQGLPLLEDNPYGDLWFDQAPPAPLTARNPEGCLYLGSFSKVLAPGLRLGYMVAPKALMPKLLQAKQAADLHSPSFNQRAAYEVMKGDFLPGHIQSIRALYKAQRDAMLESLAEHFPNAQQDPEHNLTWNHPDGGMFLWARLPAGLNAVELLPKAVDAGVAYVPGAPFFATGGDPRSLRFSFVTPSVDEIRRGVAALAQAIKQAQ
ncbi:PLP-dependent aminotransferase family protein [Curvibacter sp. CHRR-16]|uniref:aminotransferase-like domain-containing protein n=1 Tax=Curvibacter sp. CHRR-16 TaxID=2835872 RepID=UPI001BDA39D9|nr:PLP-dependent aminotransferase family protein [Curvibacter sp. CHRR-16]MBT0569849.1 PLP-dependent aminotransferase family protein [Curvibacter sp. CHRR-16]